MSFFLNRKNHPLYSKLLFKIEEIIRRAEWNRKCIHGAFRSVVCTQSRFGLLMVYSAERKTDRKDIAGPCY